MKTGSFIVSLDFELLWGVQDHRTIADYGANILGGRKAIPAMLGLFSEYGIHATWATVGLLFFDKKSDLLSACPTVKPSYDNSALSPYSGIAKIGEGESADPYHFGKSLIELIQSCPGQEVGTHTFSHYYCQEPGQTKESFRAGMVAAIEAASRMGITLTSLVFPRNQSNKEDLFVCAELGIKCFRGNESSWFYRQGSREGESNFTRAARLADAYINLSGDNTFVVNDGVDLVNVPASHFLRPYSRKLAFADPLRRHRTTHAIRHAAKKGESYHLWWHPHNFGVNLEENIAFLREVLDCYAEMRVKHGMQSLTMNEAAEQVRHA
jgi:hypothetical protein